MAHPKVLVIGLDGGSLPLLKRQAAQGRMPFFARVLQEGVAGELRTVSPPITPTAWATFITGKNPGKHGIFDFFTYKDHATPLRVVNSRAIKSDTLWSVLSRAGKRIGVVNVPMTYPPQEVNGVMITGLLTPSVDETFTHPPALYESLRGELGEYIIGVTWKEYSRHQIPQYLKVLRHCTQQRGRYIRHLMESRPWDFFMAVFSETDFIQHALWSFLDPEDHRQSDPGVEEQIGAYYSFLDATLAELQSTAGPETQLFFISDHGFGPLKKWARINTWLAQQGLLAFDRRQVFTLRTLKRLKDLVQRLDRNNWRKKLPRRPRKPAGTLSWIRWERTRAFAASSGEQGIRINLKGREPNGIVAPGREYEELREHIITELRKLRDKDSEGVPENFVARREEVFSGPFTERAPDIVFLMGEGQWLGDIFPAARVFEPVDWDIGSGTHRMQGLFAAVGPGIKKGSEVHGARLEDVFPTLLYSLGEPIPGDLDGSILSRIYEESFLAGNSPRFLASTTGPQGREEAYSADEEQQVLERLRGLGYIE